MGTRKSTGQLEHRAITTETAMPVTNFTHTPIARERERE